MSISSTRSSILITILLTLVSGCTSDSGAPGASVADGQWHVASEPTIRIGAEGLPEAEFSRIVGLATSTSGDIVVADGGSSELRVFSPRGNFLRKLSRSGSGPAEMQMISWFGHAGDSLYVTDGISGTVSTFTTNDGFVSRDRFRGALPGVRARLASGSFVVQPSVMRRMNVRMDQVSRDTVRIGLISDPARADSVKWLGGFPGNSFFGYRHSQTPDGVAGGFYTLGPQFVVGASGDRVWIGDSARDTIAIFDGGGELVAQAVWPDPPEPWDSAKIDQAMQTALSQADMPDQQTSVRTLYDASLRPPRQPLFTSFLAGPDGEMWVQRFRLGDDEPRSFVVFDSSGVVIGRLSLSAGLEPKEIGRDFVLGITRSDLGVESVVRYSLQRP